MHRPRRLRKNPIVREMVAETKLSKDMFIYPYFVVPGKNVIHPIDAMPGVSHFSTDTLLKDVEKGLNLGVNKIMLFGVGDEKSEDAKSAYDPHSLVPVTVKQLKQNFGDDLYVVTDVCVCSYTTHGHCGIMKDDYIQNDLSVDLIAKMALTHAAAGADMLATSDMMDGRVAAIRQALEETGHTNVGILSYAAKYASSFYGPFRSALDSAPKDFQEIPKDKKTYQMDFHNSREALNEVYKDIEEGADIIMIKPGLPYLDIVAKVRQEIDLPIAVYNVSGEYAMLKAAAQNGWLDNDKAIIESLTCIKRAGADMIFTYAAKEAAILLNN